VPHKAAKIQRWVDLLAELLARNYPVSLEELTARIPAYRAAPSHEARRRMFERDKDELKAFGIPLTHVESGTGESIGYAIDRKAFYLPYLALRAPTKPHTAAKAGRTRRRQLPTLEFDADELAAVVDAVAAVRQVGDPLLADAAASGLRKLAFDLPVDSVRPDDSVTVVPPRRDPDPELFAILTDALDRRKLVSFDYHAMGRDETRRREVEPWGLFFIGQHWYLAARDPAADGLRNFRLSRMADVRVNEKREQSPDFTVPRDFRLRDHARSREAWALGDAEAVTAVVRVDGELRQVPIRRLDVFARWLLSSGGAMRPVEPPELVAAYDDLVHKTLALYADP
jgi:proteasome accessory factor B